MTENRNPVLPGARDPPHDLAPVEPTAYGFMRDGQLVLVCPSCQEELDPADVVLEGGGQCPGCKRSVGLLIASWDHYGEMRNVPADEREEYA